MCVCVCVCVCVRACACVHELAFYVDSQYEQEWLSSFANIYQYSLPSHCSSKVSLFYFLKLCCQNVCMGIVLCGANFSSNTRIQLCTYVCMYVHAHICMCTFTYICTYVCVQLAPSLIIYVCMCVHGWVPIY